MTEKTYGPNKLTIEHMHSNKQDADAAGHSHYFTGVPCIHGHLVPRKTKNGVCLECLKNTQRKYYSTIRKPYRNLTEAEKKKRIKAYYQANREKFLQNSKEYREANREKIKVQRQQYWKDNKERLSVKNKAWRKSNKDKINKRDRELYRKNPF